MSVTDNDFRDEEPRGKHAKIVLPEISQEDFQYESSFFSGEANSPDLAIPKKKSKALKVVLIILGILLVILLAVYGAGCFYFTNHFYPNTVMGNSDISLETTEDLSSQIRESGRSYSLKVTGKGMSMTITSADMGLDLDENKVANTIMGSQNVYAWPIEVFKSHDLGEAVKGAFKTGTLEKYVTDAVNKHNKTATPTTDASIQYDATTKQFKVVKETYGDQLDVKLVMDAIGEAVSTMSTTLELTDKEVIQPKLVSTDPRFTEAVNKANTMIQVDVTYKLGDDVAAVMNGDIANQWISISDTFEITMDTDKIGEWAQDIATERDTVGVERTYTRYDGKEITVKGGDYGWKINHNEFVDIVYGNVTDGNKGTVQIPTTQTATGYNGPGKADWGKSYIDVDLDEQHVYYFNEEGELIWESDCVSGSTLVAGRATPQGVWDLNAKESPSTLRGYKADGELEYETVVKYWMPFEGNGVGFHDATWQPDFGGDMYQRGYGSHGCINLPLDAAAELYDIIEYDIPIIVHE